jgi:SAM-dependent methyltransferase
MAERLNVLLSEVPPDWQHVYVGGYCSPPPKEEWVSPHLFRSGRTNGTYAYVVRAKEAKSIARFLSSIDQPADNAIADLITAGKVISYTFVPHWVDHCSGHSDINQGHRSYPKCGHFAPRMADERRTDWWNRYGVSERTQFLEWVGDTSAPSRQLARRRIAEAAHRSLLDCGCGTCVEYDGFAADGYPIDYHGIDTCAAFVAEGQARKIDVREASIEAIPFPDHSIDVVYARHVLEHLLDFRPALSEMIRVARREVMVTFFLQPTKTEKVVMDRTYGVDLPHVWHSVPALMCFLQQNPLIKSVEWEHLGRESLLRIIVAAHPRLLIGALSGLDMHQRRATCRATWVADAKRLGVDVVFLVGGGGSLTEPIRVDDILLLPCPDGYPSLPQRTRWFCRWALGRSDWDYLLKCDDDTFVAVERLLALNLDGIDYTGQSPGGPYASGGAGYLLSRKAAQVVANDLTDATGSEDVLVGEVLRTAGIDLTPNERFIPFGSADRCPRSGNYIVTTHAVSNNNFQRYRDDTDGEWPFRIVIPTSNRYAGTVLPITLRLLQQYWPDHPPIDVVFYEVAPPDFNGACFPVGCQADISWTTGLATYLRRHNKNQLLLLMLDDYGLCGPVNRLAIREAAREMLSDPAIANAHLTWQPVTPKQPRGPLLQLPRWSYSINTQAALWRRDLLLEVLMRHADASIERFELEGSKWFNAERFDCEIHCQVPIPEPDRPSECVDATDKSYWAFPYHNLMHRGAPNSVHVAFLAEHGQQLALACF